MSTALEMPISSLILYNNGYGVFRREVTVKGRGHIDLFFEAKDMESVLKSLSFTDSTGSSVGNISYETKRPESSFTLEEDESVLALVKSLQGFNVCLVLNGGEEIMGRVLGTDRLEILDSGGQTTKLVSHVCLLLPKEGSLVKYSIDKINMLKVLDTAALKDIEYSLDLIQSSEKTNMQKLTVFYQGDEEEKLIAIKYGLIMNEWQSSYRLVLKQKSFASPEDEGEKIYFRLEGLAVVDNVKDEDWNQIKLSLVVGAPIIPSATSTTSGAASSGGVMELTIKQMKGGDLFIRANPRDTIETVISRVANKKGITETGCKLIFAGKQLEHGRSLQDYNITSSSTLQLVLKVGAAQAGTLSQPKIFVMASQENLSYYHIDLKVTAKRKQKAIVPLMNVELYGQHVALYDETIRKGNPLSAILFENTTGRTLDGGSIQIMNDDLFLGEGIITTLHPGDESAPIPYCVQSACEVSVDYDISTLKYHRINISNGKVQLTRKRRQRTIYRIKNKISKRFDFMLNHQFLDGWALLQKDPNNPQNEIEEPVDITDRHYQFRFFVEPNIEKMVFNVREENNDVVEKEIESLNLELLEEYNGKGYLDKLTYDSLFSVHSLGNEISEIGKTILDRENEIRELTKTESRLRNNITTLTGHEKESQKYIKQLGATEDKIIDIQHGIKILKLDKTKLQMQMDEKIDAISFSKNFDIPSEDEKDNSEV